MDFVLDNSITMRWLFGDGSATDQSYAQSVLAALTAGEALVPGVWCLEVANVIARAERKYSLAEARSEEFLQLLQYMPIKVVNQVGLQALSTSLDVARRYGLSSYDAAYLSLAMRTGLPLATLDEDLILAANKAKVLRFGDH